MSSCNYTGNSDMYGLGIRIGFYLQWYGTIIATWLAESEVPGLRLANSFFIGATFLAMIIQTSTKTVQPLDTYITLLLTYGSYYTYVPIYLWRLVTGCSPFWDPSRWPRVPPTTLYTILNLWLLMAVSCFQMWFWTTGIKIMAKDSGCQEYGFFFTMVPLDSDLSVATNILFTLALLVCCSFSLCLDTGLVKPPRWLRRKEQKYKRQMKKYGIG